MHEASPWLGEELAIVQSVDSITPIVDDPSSTGAIAAVNLLSDIYAMGARPLIARNIVGFPAQKLPLDVLKEIARGGAEKAREATGLIPDGAKWNLKFLMESGAMNRRTKALPDHR